MGFSGNLLGIDVHHYLIQIVLTALLLILGFSYLIWGLKRQDPKNDDNFIEAMKTVAVLIFGACWIAIGKLWGILPVRRKGPPDNT